jgi:hypothetical protein
VGYYFCLARNGCCGQQCQYCMFLHIS